MSAFRRMVVRMESETNTAARHDAILDRLRERGKVQATPLARAMGVAVQTIRRDLRDLAARGLIERVHGGAVLPSGIANIAWADRRALSREAKARIATATAALIADGASVFLGIGTTTEAVARALSRHRALMVVTNNLHVATILSGCRGMGVTLTGGTLRSDGGLTGELTEAALAGFRPDIAVTGISAIDAGGDLLDYDPAEARVTRAALAAARRRILVADATKWGRKAPLRVAGMADIDTLVTDAPPPGPRPSALHLA